MANITTTKESVLSELKPLARDGYKKVLLNHGATEPCLGVKIEELKKIQKRVKKDYRLALELYDTGIYDAMYLAGLIADDSRMTRKDLQRWINKASKPIAGSTVPSVAAGSPHGWDIALEWIESKKDLTAAAGWTTLSSLVSVKQDTDLDLSELKRLLHRVLKRFHQARDAVRYAMNGFVIGVGSYVRELSSLAIEIGEKIGPVTVDMGPTACQVPFAPDYILKVEKRRGIGKKRKSAKC